MTDPRPIRYRRKPKAPLAPPKPVARAVRRVLLVEDSSATTDLVTLVLTQAGHKVTAVADGLSAIAALETGEFDVVLTDFHLPDIKGIEVARRYRATLKGRAGPSFIAITGDVRGLLSDPSNCEVFDRVVAKPLDIDAVCALVETPIQPAQPQAVPHAPARRSIEDFPFAFWRWPDSAVAPADPSGIDAILILDDRDLSRLRRIPNAHLLPVIDATGRLGPSADMDASELRLGDDSAVETLISAFHGRRAELHRDFHDCDDIADRLLARAFVANSDLIPRRDGRATEMIAWNALVDADEVPAALNRLRADGLVQLTFFERLHHCPGCRSARLIVREQCPRCASAQLKEESYLHHFRCAFQGPESDFVVGDDLKCPKCRRELHHFGTDYDRPGQFVTCSACTHTTSEPDIAFVCADCDRVTPSDAAHSRDIFNATLTDRARAYLAAGKAALGRGARALRFSDLPFDLIVALNRAASAYNDDKTPFSLVHIGFDRLFDLRLEQGARQTEDARRLWFECFRQSLGRGCPTAMGDQDVYALLDGRTSNDADATLDRALQEAQAGVRLDLGATLKRYGPEDLAR